MILKVDNLVKKYDSFELKNVSFQVEEGSIMGFIGRNGAGKTTTMKGIMNVIHLDSGNVTVFDENYLENQIIHKEKIAFALGGANFYPQKKLKDITMVVKRFYKQWDNDIYLKCLKLFELEENKKIKELSAGMKVKYALALALSHKAQLFILDEPTSGLDPVSRDEILEIFRDIIKDKKRSILFSTHITSDLEKCATHITYIKKGTILASMPIDDFVNNYLIVNGAQTQLELIKDKLIAYKENDNFFEGIIIASDRIEGLEYTKGSLEEIMVHIERRNGDEEFTI